MLSVIVAFLRQEDAAGIRSLLVKNGYDVAGACTSGAQAVSLANELDGGVIICGYRMTDMHYSELYRYLPRGYRMILVASPAKWRDQQTEGIVCVEMPVKAKELLRILEEELSDYRRQRRQEKESERKRGRSEGDKRTILQAKTMLMERNQMSEEEAHRYIQKISMDSGNSMVETAKMVLTLM